MTAALPLCAAVELAKLQSLELTETRLQQRNVAAELVNDGHLHQYPLLLGQEQDRTVQGGEDPALVDIPYEQHRRTGVQGHLHIDDVALPQVDLSRTTGALDDHNIVLAAQTVQCARDRVHVHRRSGPGGLGLDPVHESARRWLETQHRLDLVRSRFENHLLGGFGLVTAERHGHLAPPLGRSSRPDHRHADGDRVVDEYLFGSLGGSQREVQFGGGSIGGESDGVDRSIAVGQLQDALAARVVHAVGDQHDPDQLATPQSTLDSTDRLHDVGHRPHRLGGGSSLDRLAVDPEQLDLHPGTLALLDLPLQAGDRLESPLVT